MASERTAVPPIDLKAGDRAYNYLVLEDAQLLKNGSVIAKVRYFDGGVGLREWTKEHAPHVSIPLSQGIES